MENFPLNEIQVVSSTPSVIAFCENVNLKIFPIERNEDLSMDGLRAHKALLEKWAAAFEEEEVYFTFTGFDLWGLFLMKTLKAKNKVVFMNRDPVYPVKNSKLNLVKKGYRKAYFKRAIYSKVINYKFDVFERNQNSFFLGIAKETLEKQFHEFRLSANCELLFQNIEKVLAKFAVPEFDVLLIDTECIYFDFKNGVIDQLKKTFENLGLKVAVKPHPSFQPKENLFSEYPVIDKLVPVEMLLNKDKMVMGVYSGALSFFAKHQPTVSMFDFIEMGPEADQTKIEKDLKAIDGLIMPANAKQVEKVLQEFRESIGK
jgi:hypothetical protein